MKSKQPSKGTPLADSEYLLEKFPGKGGWTYAKIPEISQDKNNPFGWVLVKGNIDDFQIRNFKLMPMGEGKVFLPVKTEIRKKIGKQAGDYVRITLYPDDTNIEIPEEIIDCFKDEPEEIKRKFISLSEGQKKAYLDWIYEAKTDDTKATRILEMMEKLRRNLGFYDKT
ncbi:YdeI/OmpD-associated family protein [Pontixanthobacter gangjinensis]|uniref:DUF1905 domain-containing protein n=1 Tax=Christiangramia aestuarii TaxID=1028746 RepID=A0A7K1LSW7_9FLAO|nr:YdeI/OmpD-associated family protein [Christiangramia aestuarii]MUP43580.1 DUF1905 domain-containing protein [Christiangramia aestuarii]